jgi:ribosome recycling factor
MQENLLNEVKDKMEKTIETMVNQFSTVRTGRASAALVQNIRVDYYGAPTPLQQLAGISIPEPRMLVISPYDKTILKDIEKEIMKSDLGITPQNDGNIIRLSVPQLTEERRKDLVKNIKKLAEGTRVSIRNIRRDINDQVKKLKKNSEITEDDVTKMEKEVQGITDDFIKKVDELLVNKEKEVMTV